ncbi:hypothetical protein KKB18_08680, partial [bacterium]|nr:hypothetical protein [bacterium]
MKVKNKRFPWLLLLLITIPLFADDSLLDTAAISANELPTLSESVFGIRLGESQESVKKRCEEKNLQVVMDYNTNDSSRLGRVGKIYGDLVGGKCDELIIETLIYYYQDRIYEVQVAFKNNSENNFRLYDNFLEKRYKRIGSYDLESKSRFCFASASQNININLNRNANYYDPTTGNSKVLMLLTYEYVDLRALAVKEEKRKPVENT